MAITDPASVAELAAKLPDVTLLINNAATDRGGPLLTGPMDEIRGDFETNFFGTLSVSRAFAPILAANDPRDVVARTLDGVVDGQHEVLADELSQRVKAGLAGDPRDLYPALA